MPDPTNSALTITDATRLTTIIHAAMRRLPCARALEGGTVVYGTVHTVGDEHGEGVPANADVRDAHLQVQLTTGERVFWPIAELMMEVQTAHFMVGVLPPVLPPNS